MRFLIDSALSPAIAEELQKEGHDALHVRDYGMEWLDDSEVLALAARRERALVTCETKFLALIVGMQESRASVVLLSRTIGTQPRDQAAVLLGGLNRIQKALEQGSFVVVEEFRTRAWYLPLAARGGRTRALEAVGA